jgi:3-dehydroquinate synthase
MRTVPVPLGDRAYMIHAGSGLLARAGEYCRRLKLGERCAVITDTNVGPVYADSVVRSLKTSGFVPTIITVPAGESAKALKVAGECYDQLAIKRLERKSFVFALGGGCVGDLAGFVAATYLRGIPFVQAPTTLLAQVDSSVGGKVGVNLKVGKNLVGSFHQPKAVLCDLDVLDSLPDREFRAGLAEVVKYGAILDAELFQRLEREMDKVLRRDKASLLHIVTRSCTLKAEVVVADETETTGRRALLNFGHTLGHAIEAVTGFGEFLHGEAISVGQVAAAALSTRLSDLSAEDGARLRALLEKTGLPVRLKLPPKRRDALVQAMRLDKKSAQGEVRFVLLRRIGEATAGHRVADADLHAAMAAVGA